MSPRCGGVFLASESTPYRETAETTRALEEERLSVETQGRPGDELRLYVDMNRVHFFDTKTEKNIFYHGGQQ